MWFHADYDDDPESALDSPVAADRQLGASLLLGNARDTAIPRLRALLEDPNPQVADAAAQALGSVGDQRSLEQLLANLSRRHPRETPGTAWAVAQLGLFDLQIRAQVVAAISQWRKRSRGFSREHADALLAKLARKADQQPNVSE